jgi:hypothetical protein
LNVSSNWRSACAHAVHPAAVIAGSARSTVATRALRAAAAPLAAPALKMTLPGSSVRFDPTVAFVSTSAL